MWDWADPKVYLHDEIATDKRNPTVNANGPIYGALEESGDYLPVVDPTRNATSQVKLTVRDPKTPSSGEHAAGGAVAVLGRRSDLEQPDHACTASRWTSRARVWAAARIRKPQTPAWCQAGSDHPSAKLFPITQSQRGLELYDPKTKTDDDDRHLLHAGAT